ncbi:MAG TPA: hypothetical protein VKU00_06765 [Chthonomonadaceae bacterium]|nr:hypothetical protein [Chthonomonadaceae bacterium]
MKATVALLCTIIGSALAGLAVTLALPQAIETEPRWKLTPLDEAIVQHPFASPEVQQHLHTELHLKEQKRELKSLLPRQPTPDVAPGPHSMGWAQTDRDYWERIPPAARDIPQDWSQLPVVRFANTELGGTREIRLHEGPEYDQWLLSDPLHDLTACISIQKATRRIYFMEIARQKSGGWNYHVAFDNCYSCHTSGPRVIRPFNDPSLDRRTLDRFNKRLFGYGACDFGDSVDPDTCGDAQDDMRCNGCHNGVQRGKLYQVHSRAITFKTEHERTMPPHAN